MGKKKIRPSAYLYPMPTTIVGASVMGKPSFTTIAFCGNLQYKPPKLGISCGKNHYITEGIKKSKTFSVNIPSTDMVVATDYVGITSGRKTDKSQIFDVLSFILDENNNIQKYNKSMGEFVEKQIFLLESLGTKFPNIDVFSENLELAKNVLNESKELSSTVDGENNKVFEAMELMQYHDINRQKIERVMSVIKSLSTYLNGIFEDDSNKPEVQIAKHISGDGTSTVGEDDLEALISQFGNEG